MSLTKQIMFKSHKMKKVYDIVDKVATSNLNIIIFGEAGVGKANIAKLIHMKDTRGGAFEVIESWELKDIASDKKAVDDFIREKLQAAKNGILVVKAANMIPLDVQERIAVLSKQQKTKNAARLIITTHEDLRKKVRQNKASHVLCDILVVDINIAPLRDRREDVATYCAHYLRNHAISKDALDILTSYDWHGNVNELTSMLKQLLTIAGDNEITASMIPAKLRKKHVPKSQTAITDDLYRYAKLLLENNKNEDMATTDDPYSEYQKYVEVPLIQAALDISGGNKVQAAKLININRNTLNKKIKEYNIE